MLLLKHTADLAQILEKHRSERRSIGFVPTMGALHAGHISLIDISKKSTDITVCSIFVNPTQFNDPKDFQKYPITIENDIFLLERAGVDVLLLPQVTDIYPEGLRDLEVYDLGSLESLLEGAFRPGHFQGVCQVMRRLLEAVRPDQLFMGQKDYQQCMVVRRLLGIIGLPTRLHSCPIVREKDGLAMSSRNMRLPEDQRRTAPAIYRALTALKEGWNKRQDPASLIESAASLLAINGFRVDYVSIADQLTLEPTAGAPAVALVAAFLGEIRLIDNMAL
ncbi:MAG TPA: pantoate--beta-alanine ligase [Puia sp.]|jgi:pantoate--beta-alanine ligase